MRDGTCPDSRMVRRIAFFPVTPSCPTYSSIVVGLTTSAKGALRSGVAFRRGGSSNVLGISVLLVLLLWDNITVQD